MLPGHTASAAPIPQFTDSESVALKVLPCLLDIGESMILAGADVNLVELLVRRVGHAYGAVKMNVLVITASIIVTMTMPDTREYTQTRRIENAGETDFAKLEKLTNLCIESYQKPIPPDELKRRFEEIRSIAFPKSFLFVGGVIASASFAVFFGGSILDGVVTAAFAVLMCLMIVYLKPITPNTIAFNFMSCAITGLCIGAASLFVPNMSVDMVIIGVIMLLIPGVAMTNATRDMISGDTISGVMRFVETILWAASIALGFMASLWIMGVQTSEFISNAPPLISFIACIPATFGFALFFDVRKSLLAITTIGGVITWGIYLLLSEYVSADAFTPTFIASCFAAIYSEVLAKRFRTPTSTFFIISVIPLVPGRALYFTMKCALLGSWAQFGDYGLLTLQFVLGIALSISVVWAISRTWSNFRNERDKRYSQKKAG
ncbi:threonine/serine exporter ThrE family protein [Adlercreutzia sp. ZJ154]|uniref:threonine/serine ThrE exporter family protein n=1 Tax=Adlercreutzia sp. ZJ154 TaxID=2709790 RepID=UPI0013ED2CB5|nr:threonine/serine exporter family protein [Adlercreutzia sp. ZJ154]